MKTFKDIISDTRERSNDRKTLSESLSGLQNNNKLYNLLQDTIVDMAWDVPTGKELDEVIGDSIKYIVDGLIEDLKEQIKNGDVGSDGEDALKEYLKIKKMTLTFK